MSWKDRKPVVPALHEIDRAEDAQAGPKAPEHLEAGYWGTRYLAIIQGWRRNWDRFIPFLAFAEADRIMIHTTNSIAALNSKLRRAVKIRGYFANDDAAVKLIYLV